MDVPIGVTSDDILADPVTYRGGRAGGLNYSQFNVWIVASPAAPDFYVTYAQTSLLLAEAAQRGWVTGGDQQRHITKMESRLIWQAYSLYPGTTPISAAEIDCISVMTRQSHCTIQPMP